MELFEWKHRKFKKIEIFEKTKTKFSKFQNIYNKQGKFENKKMIILLFSVSRTRNKNFQIFSHFHLIVYIVG